MLKMGAAGNFARRAHAHFRELFLIINVRKQCIPAPVRSPRASLVGSATPHANARHVAVSPRHTHNSCPLCYEECRSSQFVAKASSPEGNCRDYMIRGLNNVAARGAELPKLTKNAEHGLLGIFVNLFSLCRRGPFRGRRGSRRTARFLSSRCTSPRPRLRPAL